MKNVNALAYDAKCKKVLCDKRLLSLVLKLGVEEYKDYSIAEIEPLIEPGIVTGEDTHLLFPRVNEMIEEEGRFSFDILFTSKYPNSEETVDTIINLEMQNDAAPRSVDGIRYPLTKRGIFYAGNMLSKQKGTIFTKDNYQNLKKVNSIWICPRPKKEKTNSVQRYKLVEFNAMGKYVAEEKENYDMINVCMINLGKDRSVEALEPLNELFVHGREEKEIYKNLKEKYGIEVYEETKGEIRDMCNFSNGIYEDGVEMGIKQGLAQGISQGREYEKIANIKILMETMNVSYDVVVSLLKLSEEDKIKYKKLI